MTGAGQSRCLHTILVWLLLMGDAVFLVESLLCYCTEPDCVSGERTNRCKADPVLGCYKEYYRKMNPPVTMGCMRNALLCSQDRMRPKEFNSDDWSIIVCCFTDLCNQNLSTPSHIHHDTPRETTTVNLSGTTTVLTTEASPGETGSGPSTSSHLENVHPLFMLLIALVALFLLVVFAAILVIKVMLYSRHKSKEKQRHWKVQQQTTTHTQTAHLLTSTESSSQQTSTNTLLEAFDDVP